MIYISFANRVLARPSKHCFAFTLLELIVVIIIVAVLASLALPRLFKTIEAARAVEAWSTISTVRRAAETCVIENGSYNPCITWGGLGLDDLGQLPGSHFHYCMGCSGKDLWRIVACRNSLDGGKPESAVFFEVKHESIFWGAEIYKCGQGDFAKIGSCYFDITALCGCP